MSEMMPNKKPYRYDRVGYGITIGLRGILFSTFYNTH